ncbi:MAG: NADH/ubiquinone/plastoquinone (complex I), partial [Desulfuromonadales bacterium]|nr:NADH/ubiquinone/plastoquinone (complex I) [Desulfuromonadales bacterium]
MNGVFGQLLLLLVPLLPLALTPLFVAKKLTGGRKALFLLPLGALPALLTSLLVPLGTAVELPWLLLGGGLALDATGRVFLLFISLLWLLAAVYAVGYLAEDRRQGRFFSLFLLAMAGNLGVLIAQDIPLFYLFFALMSFSSYVLVIHNGSREALRAGRVYLTMVVLGELCSFSGLLLAAEAGQTLRVAEAAVAIGTAAPRETILLLLIVGFGIKAGLFPLHLWLPLAHPVA